MLEYISRSDEIDKLIILGTHKQQIKCKINSQLIEIQNPINEIIDQSSKYYILVVLQKIIN